MTNPVNQDYYLLRDAVISNTQLRENQRRGLMALIDHIEEHLPPDPGVAHSHSFAARDDLDGFVHEHENGDRPHVHTTRYGEVLDE
jgi:hypothetical protein